MSWLAGRLGDQRKSMQPIGEFSRQEAIDQTVPFDAALSFELARHHPDAIMRAPAVARADMSRVSVGFV
jgi:hypothetical protein